MEYLKCILLGLVQGVAEFLPISSSGHLAIVNHLIGGELETIELNVALHLGTLLSILVVYRKELPVILTNRKLCLAIIIATLPLVLVALVAKDQLDAIVDAASASPLWAGCGLLVTSLLLFLIPRVEAANPETRELDNIRLKDAFIIGLFQVIAPLPGVSRSGSTIFGGLFSGLKREAAAPFSFFIAIPAICGAVVFKAKDLFEHQTGGTNFGPLLVGTLVAFVVGVISLKWLLKIIATRRLSIFAWYCLIVGLSIIAWQLLSKTPAV